MFEAARCSAFRLQRWALRQHTRALISHSHGCCSSRTFSAARPLHEQPENKAVDAGPISKKLKKLMKRNNIGAAAVTAQDGHAKQGPLAIPFGIPNVDEAKVAFKLWKDLQGGMTFDSSAVEITTLKPVYLPFFAFDGTLSATFTGQIGYTKRERYVDDDGKSHTKTSTDWYSCDGMRVGPKHIDPTVNVAFLQYAGFAHRREFVHKALEVDSTSNWLNGLPRINVDEMTAQLGTARPLHAAMLPYCAGVHEFEAKPSFSFAAAKAGLNDIAYTMANKKLRDPMLSDKFTPQYEWTHNHHQYFERCPATDWKRPDRYSVDYPSVRTTVSDARLLPYAGVVLVPFWICEYTLKGNLRNEHGSVYRAFMNGVTGKVAGMEHVDAGKAQAAAVVCASCVSIAGGFFFAQETGAIQAAAMIALAGPVIGWFGGAYYSKMSAGEWEEAGRQRDALRKQNEGWPKQPYWQSELQTFASSWESQEDARLANADKHAAHAQQTMANNNNKTTDADGAAGAGGAGGANGVDGVDGSTDGVEKAVKVDKVQVGAWRDLDDYAILGLDEDDFEGTGVSKTIKKVELMAEIVAARRAQRLVWAPHRYNENADPVKCAERLKRIDEATENLLGRDLGFYRDLD